MQEFCCFIVFLCQYIHSFRFPEMAGGRATAPPANPLNLTMRPQKKIDSKCCIKTPESNITYLTGYSGFSDGSRGGSKGSMEPPFWF